jgi:hypothetical protein
VFSSSMCALFGVGLFATSLSLRIFVQAQSSVHVKSYTYVSSFLFFCPSHSLMQLHMCVYIE